ncbi:MAG: ABC transporter substrate-binding protein [Christensenellales bacterium]
MRKYLVLFMVLMMSINLVGVAESQPVTIENMGRTTVYEQVPERVYLFSYSMAEFFAALGLEDKVIALVPGMYAIDDVLPKYREAIEKMPLITEGLVYGSPNSIEVVLDTEPDFAFGDSYNFMPRNAGAPEDYDKFGIKIYATQGTCVANASLNDTYEDILNLGKIFRVEERAEALVAEMRAEEEAIRELMKDVEPVSVFAYDSGEGTLYTVGGGGLENELISIAGGKNVFESEDKHYFTASIESVVDANPDVILVWDYNITAEVDEKIAYLKGLPEMQDVNAVKNDRFPSVPCYSVFPSIQNVKAIKVIAQGLHPELFE